MVYVAWFHFKSNGAGFTGSMAARRLRSLTHFGYKTELVTYVYLLVTSFEAIKGVALENINHTSPFKPIEF